jgi:hypothetical protein
VKEGERELGSKGERCVVLWWWCSPFIRSRETDRRRQRVIMVRVMALMPLMTGAGLRGVWMVGKSYDMKVAYLGGQRGGGDGRERSMEVAVRPGSGGMRRGIELMGGTRMSMRGEREGN